MYAVIKQSNERGIAMKCLSIKLVYAKQIAFHYLKQDLDFELAKGHDVKIANIHDGKLDNVIVEYCLTYKEGHIGEKNNNLYSIIATPPITSETKLESNIDPKYFI